MPSEVLRAVTPVHTYIMKVASRCNINCSYCFIYNRADSRWKDQPALMSEMTAAQAARRIREHCEAHGEERVSIVYHGGEPMIGGAKHLKSIAKAFESAFESTGIIRNYGMQSNGLLASSEILDFLRSENVSLGISCDGPPSVSNLSRLDHAGNGTGERLHSSLQLITSEGRDVFSGFLSVIDLRADPCEVFDYLASFSPKRVDFLLPYDNHTKKPFGKSSFDSVEYGDWLIKLYDHWIERGQGIRMRWFTSLMQLLLGGHSLVESVGLDPVDLVVVETNGDIEAVDSLKASANGATHLGFNVFEHSFDDVLEHESILSRQAGANSLCQTCQTCRYVSVCGGGYVPNRYSVENGFDNPTIYCRDMMKLIDHIRDHILSEMVGVRNECNE